MTRGVEMMLLVASLRSAWMTAAKPRPVFELYLPTAKVERPGVYVLQAGSYRVDASIRGRLERLRHELVRT